MAPGGQGPRSRRLAGWVGSSPCHQAPAFAQNPEPSSGEQKQVPAPMGIKQDRPRAAQRSRALPTRCSKRRAEHGGGLPGGGQSRPWRTLRVARVRAPGRRGLGWHCRPRSSLPLDKPGLAHLQELTRPKPRCRLLSEGNKTGNRRLSDRHLRGCPGWRAASREAAVSSEQHLLRPVCPVAPSVLEAPQESPNKSLCGL